MSNSLQKRIIKAILYSVLMVAPVTLVFGQNTDTTAVAEKPILSKDFSFEPVYYVLPAEVPADTKLDKKRLNDAENPYSFDLSFLKNYEFKRYNMGDYIFTNSSGIWNLRSRPGFEVPYHLQQQTFDVVRPIKEKKKKNKR